MSIQTVLNRARNQMEFLARKHQRVHVIDLWKRRVIDYSFSINNFEEFENKKAVRRTHILKNQPGILSENKTDYSFYLDEIVYDAQLGFDVFNQVNEWNSFQASSSISYFKDLALSSYANLSPVHFSHFSLLRTFPAPTTGKFISLEQAKTFAKKILNKHQWVKQYAEKNFLLVFRLNYSDIYSAPKFLYGFPVWELRHSEHGNRKWK